MVSALIVGATGHVGGHLVSQARARGWTVRAAARSVAQQPPMEGVEWSALNLLDREGVRGACAGIDVILNASGIGASRLPTTLYSAGTGNLLDGMREHGVGRLVGLSAPVAADWSRQPRFMRWFVLPLLQRAFGATYDDMRQMDLLLLGNTQAWTVVRVPRITRSSPRGRYRLGTDERPPGAGSIGAADAATAMLDVAERRDLDGQWIVAST